MKRKLAALLLLLLLIPGGVLPAAADMGPKPSVNIEIRGADSPCYGTLLSESPSTGPYRSLRDMGVDQNWLKRERGEAEEQGFLAPWEKFCAYEGEEPDGFYFLNYVEDCGDGSLNWTYYPPQNFKVALWFPEEDTLVVTSVHDRYAFDSYYLLDLTHVDIQRDRVITGLEMRMTYRWTEELLAFGVRMVLTILVEVAVAWLFLLRNKQQLSTILWTNLATQLVLNGFLNWYSYCNGTLFLAPLFILAELAVLALEAQVYRRRLPAHQERGTCRPVAYALAANVVSCVLGLWLAHLLPGVF